MLYIACAIYPEAAPFIRRFACKRDDSFSHRQVFVSEEAVIVITGTSPVTAAIALTETLALLPPGATDLFANVGLCACTNREVTPGSLFLIHGITDRATGRHFFPDLLYQHDHKTASLLTVSTICRDVSALIPAASAGASSLRSDASAPLLIDMEASGLYQAALPFFSTDRMYFFKIVSDHAVDASQVTPAAAEALLADCAPAVAETVLRFASFIPKPFSFTPEESSLTDYFCRSLHCSVTMEHELRRLVLYYKTERGNLADHLRSFFAEHGLCFSEDVLLRSRKEGKDVLDAFRISCLR